MMRSDSLFSRLGLHCFAAVILLFALPCSGAEYKVGSQQAFDEISGLELEPGDAVLLKRGMRFSGMLALRGRGSKDAPIRVEAYGDGARPRIDAGGKQLAGLLVRNPSYWEIKGLEITNTDGSDGDQGTLFGIYVLVEGREGSYRHVYIGDCHVHDVNGKVAGKRRGGIHVHVKGLRATIFDDLRITNNRIERVGGVGIGNDSSCGRVQIGEDSHSAEHLWTRVYVAGNFVDHTGRNNVIARVSKDAVYERNTLANSSRYDTGHSIFCFNTDGMRIQFNEAYGNVGDGGRDRGGFDADYNCVNTFIQYNYSHDNNWFCGIMKRPNRHVVIRYNLSVNDREGIYFYGFDSRRQAEDIHIYNNTHFVRKGLRVHVFPEGRTPLNTRFENNIFYFEGRGFWGEKAEGVNTTFRNNLYHNITPHRSEAEAIVADPKFVRGGAPGGSIDLGTMRSLAGFRLERGSPAIGAGIVVKGNGGVDLLGNKLGAGRPNLGAFE